MSDFLSLCVDQLARVHGGAPRESAGRSGVDHTSRARLDPMKLFLARCQSELAHANELPLAERSEAINRAQMNCDIAASFR